MLDRGTLHSGGVNSSAGLRAPSAGSLKACVELLPSLNRVDLARSYPLGASRAIACVKKREGRVLADLRSEVGTTMFRESAIYLCSKVGPGLLGLLGVILFIRIGGTEVYGRYGLALAAVNSAVALFSGWHHQGLLRFRTHRESGGDVVAALPAAIILSSAVGLAALLILAIGTHRTVVATPAGWIVLGVLFLSTGLYRAAFTFLQSNLAALKAAGISIVQAMLAVAIPVACLLSLSRTHGAILGGLAASHVISVFVIFFKRQIPGIHLSPSLSAKRGLRILWNYGWPMSMWMACTQLLLVSDRFLISYFFDYTAVGVYASLYDLVIKGFSLFFFPITLAMHPRVMASWNEGKYREAKRIIRTALVMQLVIFVPVFMATFLFGASLLASILNEAAAENRTMVLWLTAGAFLWQSALIAHKPLEIRNRTRLMLVGAAVALASNWLGNWLLLPRFGLNAAALMTTISACVYLCVVLYFGRGSGNAQERESIC